MRFLFLAALVAACAGTLTAAVGRPAVGLRQNQRNQFELVNNGYGDILIAISSKVTEKQFPKLLGKIKTHFTRASQDLFQATTKRAYFQKITILVPPPPIWKKSDEYEEANGERFGRANVVVMKPEKTAVATNSHGPHVHPFEDLCAQEGSFLRLSPQYIMDQSSFATNTWGHIGKTIVHEFAHLRWGVKDEYANFQSDKDHFFTNTKGDVEATRCSRSIKGDFINRITGKVCVLQKATNLPERDCRFRPRYDETDSEASMAFLQFIDSVDRFCDGNAGGEHEHNADAPNPHNRICNGESTWDVILRHRDFANGNNEKKDGFEQDTIPNFRIVQNTISPDVEKRAVLVIDSSDTMNFNNNWQKLRTVVRHFILHIINSKSEIGLVQFNTDARIMSWMTKLKTATERVQLASRIPKKASYGTTAIGHGLEKAIEVLECDQKSPDGRTCRVERPGGARGDMIFIVSDGEENSQPEHPSLAKMAKIVKEKGIIVNTLLYTQDGDSDLITLAKETGGKAWMDPAINKISTTLFDSFAEAFRPGRDYEASFETLLSSGQVVQAKGSFTGEVKIDSSVGQHTVFTFTWPSGNADDINVRIWNGSVVLPEDKTDVDRQADLNLLTISLQETTPGIWKFHIENKASEVRAVLYHVTSEPSYAGPGDHVVPEFHEANMVYPISIEAFLSSDEIDFDAALRRSGKSIAPVNVFANLDQGGEPIVDASVRALFESPVAGENSTVIMNDDGVGIDALANDGLYSGTFAEFAHKDGRYSVQVIADDNDHKAAITTSSHASRSAIVHFNSTENRDYDRAQTEKVLVAPFQRVMQAGQFKVDNFAGSDAGLVMPPGRVNDLHLEGITDDGLFITLGFTATGANWDAGQASEYEVRVLKNSGSLYPAKFETGSIIAEYPTIKMDTITPAKSGAKESIVLQLLDKSLRQESLSFALRVKDDKGVFGEPSNPVMVTTRPKFEPGNDFVYPDGGGEISPSVTEITTPPTTKSPEVDGGNGAATITGLAALTAAALAHAVL